MLTGVGGFTALMVVDLLSLYNFSYTSNFGSILRHLVFVLVRFLRPVTRADVAFGNLGWFLYAMVRVLSLTSVDSSRMAQLAAAEPSSAATLPIATGSIAFANEIFAVLGIRS